jgi:hypothetical protein
LHGAGSCGGGRWRDATGRPVTGAAAGGEFVLDVPPKLAARVRVFSQGDGRKTDKDDPVTTPPSVCGRWEELGALRARAVCRLHRLQLSGLRPPCRCVLLGIDADLVVRNATNGRLDVDQRVPCRPTGVAGGQAADPGRDLAQRGIRAPPVTAPTALPSDCGNCSPGSAARSGPAPSSAAAHSAGHAARRSHRSAAVRSPCVQRLPGQVLLCLRHRGPGRAVQVVPRCRAAPVARPGLRDAAMLTSAYLTLVIWSSVS